MKESLLALIRGLLFVLFAIFIIPEKLYSQWTNGQDADLVYGQNNYTNTAQGIELNQLKTPSHMVVSATTGKVFIADYGNNRILRFGNYNSYTNGAAAELEITTVSGTTINPIALYLDAGDHLWIVDFFKSRVLRVSNASTLSNAIADKILG
ncbi:hypothetical protein, partial [Pseudopedobacter sp.]|uniref:hypothetical protein n=1 Tax=Pseudopedobacter sp. TaxID=1936787 RepID=UPI00333E7B88